MNRRAALELHAAVLLFGTAGLFGKLLDVSPMLISASRTTVAAIALFAYVRVSGLPLALPSNNARSKLTITGFLLAAHWATFFYSIQISTVAIGLIGIATYPVFVALLEPVISNRRHRPLDLICAVLVLIGLMIVMPTGSILNTTTIALLWAILSGFLFAIVTLINRSLVSDIDYRVVAFYQHSVATVVLLPFVIGNAGQIAEPRTAVLLLCLGLFVTALPHVLFLKALSQLRATYASLVTALEPVYGIILAAYFLHEVPAPRTALGAAIVIATVAIYTWMNSPTRNRAAQETR